MARLPLFVPARFSFAYPPRRALTPRSRGGVAIMYDVPGGGVRLRRREGEEEEEGALFAASAHR